MGSGDSGERGSQPALTCSECRAAMPLDRAVKVSVSRRRLTCPECGAITEWSLDEERVIDLRDRSPQRQANDDVESPGPAGRRQRE